MIEIEQDGKKDSKGDSDEYISDSNIPEMYKPASLSCWEESFASGQNT